MHLHRMKCITQLKIDHPQKTCWLISKYTMFCYNGAFNFFQSWTISSILYLFFSLFLLLDESTQSALTHQKICLLKFEMHQLVLESVCDSLNQNWIDLRLLKIPSPCECPQSHSLICSFSCFHFHHKVLAVTHHLLSLWDAFSPPSLASAF